MATNVLPGNAYPPTCGFMCFQVLKNTPVHNATDMYHFQEGLGRREGGGRLSSIREVAVSEVNGSASHRPQIWQDCQWNLLRCYFLICYFPPLGSLNGLGKSPTPHSLLYRFKFLWGSGVTWSHDTFCLFVFPCPDLFIAHSSLHLWPLPLPFQLPLPFDNINILTCDWVP